MPWPRGRTRRRSHCAGRARKNKVTRRKPEGMAPAETKGEGNRGLPPVGRKGFSGGPVRQRGSRHAVLQRREAKGARGLSHSAARQREHARTNVAWRKPGHTDPEKTKGGVIRKRVSGGHARFPPCRSAPLPTVQGRPAVATRENATPVPQRRAREEK